MAVLCLLVVAASVAVILTTQPRLGLDLRGGTQIVLQARDTPAGPPDAEAVDRAVEVLRKRVDALGVAEPVLVRSGEDRILVELPDVQDPTEAVEVLGRTAQLTVHPVLSAGDPAAAGRTLPSPEGGDVRIGPAVFTGEGVADARAGTDAQSAPGAFVSLSFTGSAQRDWETLTGQAACAPLGDDARRVAIVLDDRVLSAPPVNATIGCGVGIPGGGDTRITGQFTMDDARELALLIRGGSLPVPVEIIEQRTVGPTLGEAAIDASARAAVIGIVLTGLFLLLAYRLSGLVAVVALLGYGAISAAVLLSLGATVTLPGLAGFVLAIGMAVDANVLVFERAREEYAATGRLPRAVDGGFGGALSAITDAAVTTLLAAGLLVWLASGPVRGFGVTLGIGVLVSLFTALVLTRTLMRPMIALARPSWTGVDRLGRVRTALTRWSPRLYRLPRRWLVASGLLVLLAVLGPVLRGVDLGLEFTGGRLAEFQTGAPADPERVRGALEAAGVDRAVVTASGENLAVRTGPVDQATGDRIAAVVAEATGGAEQVRDELIGPSLGAELRTKALIALALAIAAQLVYLAVRFDWRLGVATVVALAADVVVVFGLVAWLGGPVDGVFLAALLTVIGYSVNDSVVVFDRVRELRGRRPKDAFPDVAGAAVLQTLPRTVNTGIGVLCVLVVLLAFGGGALADFALALLLGLLVGTASSVTLAAPLAVLIDAWSPGAGRSRVRRTAPPARARAGSGAVV
ncbi:MAG TPA: protein translocase subunit SecD [Pseudonocardiaceae bacterium]